MKAKRSIRALDAVTAALSQWPEELLRAWVKSPEAARALHLCHVAPADFGGEDRLAAAIGTCAADFERRVEAEALHSDGRRPQ